MYKVHKNIETRYSLTDISTKLCTCVVHIQANHKFWFKSDDQYRGLSCKIFYWGKQCTFYKNNTAEIFMKIAMTYSKTKIIPVNNFHRKYQEHIT